MTVNLDITIETVAEHALEGQHTAVIIRRVFQDTSFSFFLHVSWSTWSSLIIYIMDWSSNDASFFFSGKLPYTQISQELNLEELEFHMHL